MIKIFISITALMVSLSAIDYKLSIYDKDGKIRPLVENNEDFSELVSNKISRKSVSQGITCNENLKLLHTDKEVTVHSEVFGPLPVTLKVVNDMGEVIFTKVNQDTLATNFTIPTTVLDNDYKIEILNAFNDKNFCKIIKK